MHLSDKNMDVHSDEIPTPDEASKPIDFTVDSAGNVSPGTRQRAARMSERTPPRPAESWNRSD